MPQPKSRVSSLDELGNRDAPVGSRAWAVYFLRQAKSARKDLDSDAQRLQRLLGELESGKAWSALGVLSFGQLCSTELDLDPKQVAAIKKAREGEALRVVLGPRGRPKRGEEKPSDRRIKYGETAAYLLARLERDRPDLAELYREGKYRSVREVAIVAGIVKTPDALERTKNCYRKLTQAQRGEFIAWAASLP